MNTRLWVITRAFMLWFFAHLKRRILLYTMGTVLAILVAIFSIWAYTEILWYIAIGYEDVLFTMAWVMFWMALLPFLAMSLTIIVSMNLARQLAPVDRVISSDERKVDQWRRALAPVARPLITVIALVCGIVLALATHVHWDTWLLFENGPVWGKNDPQFGRDLQYFMFRLPLYTLINKWLFIGLLVTLILTVLTSYLFGGFRPQARGAKIPIQVNIHISVLLLALMAMLGWGMILELHLLSYSERGVITGLGFTDANASLIAYQFVATAVVTGFVLFQINIREPEWILPTIALVWLFLIGLSMARFYPELYQLVIVEPQELEREYSHIGSHLEFTRYGFDLEKVERRTTPGTMTLDNLDLERERDALSQLRLWDPDTLLINFQELQALRSYFEFVDVDVDRYVIDGKPELVMIGAREVNERTIPEESRRWQAERMIYTHGYGLVAAAPSRFTAAGLPVLHAMDLPPTGAASLLVQNPRIYYGENSPPFSVVRSETIELDRPIDPPPPGAAEGSGESAGGTGERSSQPLALLDGLSGLADRLDRLEERLGREVPEAEVRAADGSDEGPTDDDGSVESGDSAEQAGHSETETAAGGADAVADAGGGRESEGEGPRAARSPDCPSYGVDGEGQTESAEPCKNEDVGFQFYDYTGEGGVHISHFGRRLAFAVRYWDIRLALTWLLGEESRVMFHRRVRNRVQRVVPFLQVDRNPYPVAVDGRIKWIVDVYTVSDMMPYSKRVNLSDITQVDQPKQEGSTLIPEEFIRSQAGLSGTANYIRNSVKAVVDAYDGTVTLYVMDETDRVLEAWRNIFEDSFTPLSEASEALQAHFRYPHDLFKIQSVIWSDFHMESAESFYTREAAWRIPPDESFISLRRERLEAHHEQRRTELRPYWLLTRFPEEEETEFAIVQPFSPARRNVLTGYLAGFSDGDDYGRLVSYSFPPTTTILGPAQAQARIDQDTRISAWTTLRMQSGSRVSRGRLLALPVGDALLYVQPLFVQADKSEVSQILGAQLSSIPEIKKVVALFGDKVVMRDTLEAAIAAAFDLEQPRPPERDELGIGEDGRDTARLAAGGGEDRSATP